MARYTRPPKFDVLRYRADPTGGDDSSTAFQACIEDAADWASTRGSAQVLVPPGVYKIQDPSTSSHATSSDGPIRFESGYNNITMSGYGATLKVGSNGVGTAVIRNFGSKNKFLGFGIDLNEGVALGSKNNVGMQILGSGSGGQFVDGCDNTIQHVQVYNSRETLIDYSTGTVAYDHAGNAAGARVVLLTGGSFASNVNRYFAIQIPAVSGNWYTLDATTPRIDSTTLKLRSDDNPGADIAAGTSYILRGEPNQTQGHDGIQILGGYRNLITNVDVYDIGWTAIRMAGGDNRLQNFTCKDFRGMGVRVLEHTRCWITDGCISSDYNTERMGILADAGSATDASSPTNNNDVRVDWLWIKRVQVHCNAPADLDGAATCMKLAAVRHAFVEDCYVYGDQEAATGTVGLRIEDCMGECYVKNSYFYPGCFFTPTGSSAVQGAITANANSGGFAQLTLDVSTDDLVPGKSLYVYGTGIASYNREHIITAIGTAGSMQVTTHVPYVAGSPASTSWAQSVCDKIHFDNCTFEHHSNVGGTYHVENVVGREVRFRNCNFRHYGDFTTDYSDALYEDYQAPRTAATSKLGSILWTVTNDNGFEILEMSNCLFEFNSTNIVKGLRTSDVGTTATQTVTVPVGATGNWKYTDADTGNSSANISVTASATTARDAIQAITNANLSLVAVSRSGTGSGASPYVYTITFHGWPGPKTIGTIDNTGITSGPVTIAAGTTGVASAMLVTSGKTIGYGNVIKNQSTGSTFIVDINNSGDGGATYPQRATLFNTMGNQLGRYKASAVPTTRDVTYNAGDVVWIDNPGAGGRPFYVCTVTGKPATFQQAAALS